MSMGSSLVVCGQRFDIGHRVVTFEDDAAFSAYTPHCTDRPGRILPFAPARGLGAIAERWRPRRLIGGDRSLGRLRQVVRQLVVHHDGCLDSRMCFQVLHNERGLSVHLLIDNDGTIYQTLDLVDCAFQAAGVNEISIGVELTNRGDAQRFPSEYQGRRDRVTCRINGQQFLAYGYTEAQAAAMIAIGRAFGRIFPGLPQSYPRATSGDQMWGTLDGDVRQFAGYLGHYHVSSQKWDPGPFDFKYFTSKIGGRTVYPLVLPGGKGELPDEPQAAEASALPLYENNEEEGEGGYFPVGPLGHSRLWHGGLHLRAERGTPVHAPFSGKLVAARMAEECAVGSRNFVLIRSELPVAGTEIRFFTLLFHLDLETGGRDAPAWLRLAAHQLADDPVALAIDVAAGDLVGHVGEAGPPGRTEGQLHFAIMAADELGATLEPGFWTTVDGSGSGRFCDAAEIVGKIDRPGASGRRDGLVSRAELINFYRADPGRVAFRRLAVRHLSEWAEGHDWQAALGRSRDFAELPRATRARLYRDQIEPVLWWTDEIGEAAGLPADKVIWSYQPITFLLWLSRRLHAGGGASAGIASAGAFLGKAAPRHITDDADAMEGFIDDEDALYFGNKKLELEDLVNGYPDSNGRR